MLMKLVVYNDDGDIYSTFERTVLEFDKVTEDDVKLPD